MTKAIQIACEGADVLELHQLEPFQDELKELSEENAKRLTHEILTDGFSDPFNVWRNEGHFYLIDGHQRRVVLYALEDLGYEVPPLPVVWVDADSFEQAKRKVLSQAAQYGRITFEGLSKFIAPFPVSLSLPELETSFRFPEIDMGAFKKPLKDDSKASSEMVDKAAELLEKWGVKHGQIFEIPSKTSPGKFHRVMCGDSTDAGNVALLLAGAEPYLMVTDPPYGVEYDPTWCDDCGGQFGDGKIVQRGKVRNDNRTDWSDVYSLWPCQVLYSWSPSYKSCLIETGQAVLNAGFQIRGQIIWRKSHFVLSRGAYHWQHEPCWYAVRKGSKAQWIGDRRQSTVWDIAGMNPAGGGGEKKTGHGTQKPLECMARPIRNHEGDVADPFLGSGTTAVAAEQEGRICYGMEISEKYVAVVLERMTSHGLEPRLLDTNNHS